MAEGHLGSHITKDAPIRSLALVTSIAYSLVNFRGPLIQALIAAGVHVYALAPDYDEKTRKAVAALGAEPIDFSLERTGLRPIADIVDAWRLVGTLRRLKPDAILNYFIKPVIYGSLAARLAGIRHRYALVAGLGFVYTANGSENSPKRRLIRAVASTLYKQAFRACERVFFQNDDDIGEFIKDGLIDRARAVRLNGTGVDLKRHAPAPPVQWPVTFLLMARLLREKGIVEFVEAARLVKTQHPEARFVLLGGADPNPGGIDLPEVKAWSDEGVIEWPGHVDDVRPWLVQSSVYVLPSYREGMPRSTQEALAIGRAVITTDAPGCRETVRDGVNGFITPVRSVEPLAAAMLRFIDDPALILSMGIASRALAEERFDVHKINAVMLTTMGITPPDGRTAH